ncbi:MAG TPA: MFS transporter [Pseudoduganella sp.]|jgi:predicted MFS family arabinose efflux permease
MSGAAASPAAVADADAVAAPWSAVTAIGIGAFALVTSEFLPVGLLPQIGADLQTSAGQTGLMVMMPGIVAAVVAPLTLAFAGRIDRRFMLWALLALLAVSNVTVALADSFAVVLAGRFMLGVAIGGFWTIGGSLGPRLRPGEAARATSLIFAGVSVGTVAGVPIGTLVGGLLGWRMAFVGAAVASLIVTAMLMYVLPAIRPAAASKVRHMVDVLRVPLVRVGLLAALLIFMGQFAAYTYITPYLLERAQLSPAAIGPILFGYGAAGLAGNLLAGWSTTKSVRGTLLGTAALLGGSVILVVAAGASMPLVVGFLLTWGIAFGMLPIAVQSWLFSAAPDRLESVSAAFVSSGQAAIGAGALIGGLVVDHFGVTGAMLAGAGGGLATVVLIVVAGLAGRR